MDFDYVIVEGKFNTFLDKKFYIVHLKSIFFKTYLYLSFLSMFNHRKHLDLINLSFALVIYNCKVTSMLKFFFFAQVSVHKKEEFLFMKDVYD